MYFSKKGIKSLSTIKHDLSFSHTYPHTIKNEK
jgi:hypothetical protein